LGNVGSIVAFRVGHQDAAVLEETFGNGFSAEHFTTLSNHEVYAKLLADGQDREPVLGNPLPPAGTRYGRREAIIRRSREKYAARREIVEERIERWLGTPST
jgi:hypothetical protein